MEIVILPSARRHGVADDGIRHALRNATSFDPTEGDHELEMAVGPDETGALVEVGFVAVDDRLIVIHAMPARPKYLR